LGQPQRFRRQQMESADWVRERSNLPYDGSIPPSFHHPRCSPVPFRTGPHQGTRGTPSTGRGAHPATRPILRLEPEVLHVAFLMSWKHVSNLRTRRECSAQFPDNFDSNQCARRQLSDARSSRYSIVEDKHAISPLEYPRWRHSDRRVPKERNLSCQFSQVGALLASRRQTQVVRINVLASCKFNSRGRPKRSSALPPLP
jgi:hypothetical protein